MRKYVIIFSTLVFIISLNSCDTKKPKTTENNSSTEESPYLGLKPPGIVAEQFPPDIEDWVLEDVNPGMKEIYLTSSSARDAPYIRPVVSFSKDETKYNVWIKYDFYPASGGDDNIRYCKNKYIERTNTGWSEIKSLGPMFEREDWGIMRLTVSNKGTIVFDDYKNNDVIRISMVKDGKHEEPRLLGKEINTGKWTAHPFIGSDDSYIIWDSEREGGYGGSDLYISFRQQDGSWGSAINMGDNINSAIDEGTGTVTPDGKYLFFGRAEQKVREDGSTYWVGSNNWVDAKVIENLRSQQ